MSDLVGNPEDWFSHGVAHMVSDLITTVCLHFHCKLQSPEMKVSFLMFFIS